MAALIAKATEKTKRRSRKTCQRSIRLKTHALIRKAKEVSEALGKVHSGAVPRGQEGGQIPGEEAQKVSRIRGKWNEIKNGSQAKKLRKGSCRGDPRRRGRSPWRADPKGSWGLTGVIQFR